MPTIYLSTDLEGLFRAFCASGFAIPDELSEVIKHLGRNQPAGLTDVQLKEAIRAEFLAVHGRLATRILEYGRYQALVHWIVRRELGVATSHDARAAIAQVYRLRRAELENTTFVELLAEPTYQLTVEHAHLRMDARLRPGGRPTPLEVRRARLALRRELGLRPHHHGHKPSPSAPTIPLAA